MPAIKQIITMKYENLVKELFPVATVQAGVNAMAKTAIEVMRDRTNKGYDVNGKRFAPLSQSYQYYKKRYIKKGKKVNEFAATKLPNHIRLSGALFGAMKTQVIQYAQFNNLKLDTAFRLYVDSSQSKKVKNLLSDTGVVRTRKGKKTYKKAVRNFFGIGTVGNRAEMEKDKIIGAFIKSLKYKVGGSRKNFTIKG